MQPSFEECCCTLEAARAAQRQPTPPASIPVPASALREKVQAASGSLRVAVSKAAILLGGKASAEERAALSVLVMQAVLALCAACSNVKAHGGKTLQAAVNRHVLLVIYEALAFLRTACAGMVRPEAVNQAAGQVLATCEAGKKLPVDDRTALQRALLQVLSELRDVAREAQELHMSPPETPTSGAGCAAADKAAAQAVRDSDEDLDFVPSVLCPSDLEAARAASTLLEAVLQSVKAAGNALLRDKGVLEAWDDAVVACLSMREPANDLVAGLYPPQDAEELRCQAEALAGHAKTLLEGVPASKGLPGMAEILDSIEQARKAVLACTESHPSRTSGQDLPGSGADV